MHVPLIFQSDRCYRCFIWNNMGCVCVCVRAFVVCLCGCECLHALLCVYMCGCLYVGFWVVGSCSLYFHEACSIKRTIPPILLPSSPVHSHGSELQYSLLAVYHPFLSLGFLFVFPDALPHLSHWDYKETILRAALDTRLGFFERGGRWLGFSESIQWLFNLKQRSWVVRRLLHIWLLCTKVKWMHALYILTVPSAYNSCIVQSPKSYTKPLWKAEKWEALPDYVT